MQITAPTILVMFSGGLDSLGALYKILTLPKYAEYAVHCHHISYINTYNRTLVEGQAVNSIYGYLKENGYRNFTTSESSVQIPTINSKGLVDVLFYYFLAGHFCDSAPTIEKVVIGLTKTDLLRPDAVDHELQNGQVSTEFKYRSFSIFKSFASLRNDFPVINLTKEEIWNMLPDNLRRLSWSCRTPKFVNGLAIRCNNCPSCEELQFIKQ